MRKVWVKYIASTSLVLNVLLVISIIIVILHDFVFVNLRELFEGGVELWNLAYKLSLALIGSYIFYFVVVHSKRQQDRENLLPFLQRQTNLITADARSLIYALKEQSGCEFAGDYPNLDDTKTMCAKISRHDVAPLLIDIAGTKANWIQYLQHSRSRTEKALPRIYDTVFFLDSDYLKLLTNVENCRYFTALDHIVGMPLTNGSLSFLAESLHDYFQHARGLEEYANKKLEEL